MPKDLLMKLHKLDAKIYQDFQTVAIFNFLNLHLQSKFTEKASKTMHGLGRSRYTEKKNIREVVHFVTYDEDLVANVDEKAPGRCTSKSRRESATNSHWEHVSVCARLIYRYEYHLSLFFLMTSFPESIA